MSPLPDIELSHLNTLPTYGISGVLQRASCLSWDGGGGQGLYKVAIIGNNLVPISDLSLLGPDSVLGNIVSHEISRGKELGCPMANILSHMVYHRWNTPTRCISIYVMITPMASP